MELSDDEDMCMALSLSCDENWQDSRDFAAVDHFEGDLQMALEHSKLQFDTESHKLMHEDKEYQEALCASMVQMQIREDVASPEDICYKYEAPPTDMVRVSQANDRCITTVQAYIFRCNELEVARLIEENFNRRVAVCMGFHARLGRDSCFSNIHLDILQIILSTCVDYKGGQNVVNSPRAADSQEVWNERFRLQTAAKR